MGTHTRIAAALHIVMGVLGAGIMLVAGFALDSMRSYFQQAQVPAFVLQIGAAVIVLIVLLGVAGAIAGIALLKGAPAARPFVIAFGVLGVFQFPIGTAIGAYTLWALLRAPQLPTAPARPA